MKCISRHLAEHAVLLAALAEVPVRQGRKRIRLFHRSVEHQNEFSRIGIWERPQKHGVDDGEDGGVGADAEGEREHGDGGEAGGLAQHAEGEADVL